MSRILIYDTTLRDGSQAEGISYSLSDKIKIAQKLDVFGVDYIEGGWPASNPKDTEFFKQAANINWQNAKIAAFGSTCKAGLAPSDDANLRALVECGAPVACIVGKSWDFHVVKALGTTLEENLRMIEESVRFLKEAGLEVIFDAEHFFDGHKNNPNYALQTIKAAQRGGADVITLCDTNGGCLPGEITEIITSIKKWIEVPLGIHAHNDGELAVANSLVAIDAGVTMVQGTFNGYGERCGNANLCSIIPNIELKTKYHCKAGQSLKHLTETAFYISEVSNTRLSKNQPFVGSGAFAHKGGIHVSAIMKSPETYEHLLPDKVGNKRRVLVSELAGTSNLVEKARELNVTLDPKSKKTKELIKKIKELEYEGYQFEGAEASLELFLRKNLGDYIDHFKLEIFKVNTEKRGTSEFSSEAIIKIRVDDKVVHTAAEGEGPVHAMDNALRKALTEFFPVLSNMYLVDYKVRVLEESKATQAKVRVLITSRDQESMWSTVGVSTNIIEASWQALIESMDYALLKEKKKRKLQSVAQGGE